jgi:hypothetical protein
VLFISAGDSEMAVKVVPGVLLGKLLDVVAKSPEWLEVPKHNGPPRELAAVRVMRGNGFTTK